MNGRTAIVFEGRFEFQDVVPMRTDHGLACLIGKCMAVSRQGRIVHRTFMALGDERVEIVRAAMLAGPTTLAYRHDGGVLAIVGRSVGPDIECEGTVCSVASPTLRATFDTTLSAWPKRTSWLPRVERERDRLGSLADRPAMTPAAEGGETWTGLRIGDCCAEWTMPVHVPERFAGLIDPDAGDVDPDPSTTWHLVTLERHHDHYAMIDYRGVHQL
jgi:hypothetical protein